MYNYHPCKVFPTSDRSNSQTAVLGLPNNKSEKQIIIR
jgi:hypothetical protein